MAKVTKTMELTHAEKALLAVALTEKLRGTTTPLALRYVERTQVVDLAEKLLGDDMRLGYQVMVVGAGLGGGYYWARPGEAGVERMGLTTWPEFTKLAEYIL